MSWKACFVAVFAVSAAAASSFVVVFVASSSAAASSFVAVFVASSSAAVSSLSKVSFAASSSAVSSYAVYLSSVSSYAMPSSAFVSLVFVKNRATTFAGWRTISLPKSTSFSCETMFFVFCIFCLIGCTFRLPTQNGICSKNWLPKFWLLKKKIHSYNFQETRRAWEPSFLKIKLC